MGYNSEKKNSVVVLQQRGEGEEEKKHNFTKRDSDSVCVEKYPLNHDA